jgi:hypothetical protein
MLTSTTNAATTARSDPMLFSTHPDVTRSLAAERTAGLLAEAEQRRLARRIAEWRPARFREPAPDLQRVTPLAPSAAPNAA